MTKLQGILVLENLTFYSFFCHLIILLYRAIQSSQNQSFFVILVKLLLHDDKHRVNDEDCSFAEMVHSDGVHPDMEHALINIFILNQHHSTTGSQNSQLFDCPKYMTNFTLEMKVVRIMIKLKSILSSITICDVVYCYFHQYSCVQSCVLLMFHFHYNYMLT